MKKKGFTLIEMMVVVVIIGVLVAILTPQIANLISRARTAKAISDFHTIADAGTKLFIDLGVYPEEGAWCAGGAGAPPYSGGAFTTRTLVPAAYLSKWQGPYLKIWPKAHPWGGCVTYLYARCTNCFDNDGLTNNEAYVHFFDIAGFTDAIKQEIDKTLDDGNISTGVVKEVRGGLCYFIGEGDIW